MNESLIAIAFGSFCVLLVLGGVLIVVTSIRRNRRGSQAIEERGWERRPDGEDVLAGWDGWPFVEARKPGKTKDIVTGHHQGARFLSVRWSQTEGRPDSPTHDIERYNIAALACEHDYPRLSVVRGRHRIDRGRARPGFEPFTTGDDRFDGRWATWGDPEFGRAVLTPDVRAVMDELDAAWVFQPGWVARVGPWRYWSGEDAMLEALDEIAAPLRAVPADVWRRYGGAPGFLGTLGHR